jgi:hypothetical protein
VFKFVAILTAAEFFKKLAAATFDVKKSLHDAAEWFKSCRGQYYRWRRAAKKNRKNALKRPKNHLLPPTCPHFATFATWGQKWHFRSQIVAIIFREARIPNQVFPKSLP